MKKFAVSFGGGADTILFSVKENKFFCYEKDSAELHKKCGGKLYYTSLTGQSGAGYLEKMDDLIEFGFYRTDAKSQQHIKTVHKINDRSVFGYAPYISHGGIDYQMPFVLTDGKRVMFLRADEILLALQNWAKIDLLEWKDIRVNWYSSNGGSGEYKTFYLFNPNHLSGVDVLRFVDLKGLRDNAESLLSKNPQAKNSLISKKMQIYECNDCFQKTAWYHMQKNGFFDVKWEENPRNINGEIIDGWNSDNNLFWRRHENTVEVFMEIERSDFADGKYVFEGTPKWLDYETNFSIIDWFTTRIEDMKKYFMQKLTEKARKDYVYARQQSGIDIRQLMERNLDAVICIQDSVDSGNCLPGTEAFIKQNSIETDETGCSIIGKLLENKNIDQMVKNFNFQKVISKKLLEKKLDESDSE